MKKLIIDERIRDTELEFLKKYFYVIKLPLSNDVYEEISGHSDIFYTRINGSIIEAPNAPLHIPNAVIGKKEVRGKYPNDVLYNACQIKDKIIGSKYVDASIKPNVLVKQGYVKCSVAVTSDNSCITTDKSIYEELKKANVYALYIEEENIKLLKRDGTLSQMHGFIGGATLVFDNKFVLFGDIDNLKNKEKIMEHLNRYNLELVSFKGLDIYDYGSGMII